MINLQKKKYYLHYLILFFFTYIKFLPRLQDTPVSYDRLVNILYKLYFDSVSYKYLFTWYIASYVLVRALLYNSIKLSLYFSFVTGLVQYSFCSFVKSSLDKLFISRYSLNFDNLINFSFEVNLFSFVNFSINLINSNVVLYDLSIVKSLYVLYYVSLIKFLRLGLAKFNEPM